MKARIKKTGEIIEVTRNRHGLYIDKNHVGYSLEDLDFGNEEVEHWQGIKEQAAIAAMCVLIGKSEINDTKWVVENAIEYADALVEQLKKKEQ